MRSSSVISAGWRNPVIHPTTERNAKVSDLQIVLAVTEIAICCVFFLDYQVIESDNSSINTRIFTQQLFAMKIFLTFFLAFLINSRYRL